MVAVFGDPKGLINAFRTVVVSMRLARAGSPPTKQEPAMNRIEANLDIFLRETSSMSVAVIARSLIPGLCLVDFRYAA
jgi:hypothetical protein